MVLTHHKLYTLVMYLISIMMQIILRIGCYQPALIKVSPDDGGTFNIFSSASIGEIEYN